MWTPISNRNPCRSHHRRHSCLAVVAQRNLASNPPASVAGPADATRVIRSARSMSRRPRREIYPADAHEQGAPLTR